MATRKFYLLAILMVPHVEFLFLRPQDQDLFLGDGETFKHNERFDRLHVALSLWSLTKFLTLHAGCCPVPEG